MGKREETGDRGGGGGGGQSDRDGGERREEDLACFGVSGLAGIRPASPRSSGFSSCEANDANCVT